MNSSFILPKIEDEELINEISEFLKLSKIDLYESKVNIDLQEVLELNPKLYENIIQEPVRTYQFLSEAITNKILKTKSIFFNNLRIKTKINQIRTENLDKLNSIRGFIKRTTKIIPRIISIKYECPGCGTVISVKQNKKAKKEPTGCSCGRKKGFRVIFEEKVDVQEINLEENPEELDGKQPQQIRIYLEKELTDNDLSKKLSPGKKVEVIGIIETMPPFMHSKDEENNLSDYIFRANNIIHLEEDDEINLSDEDEKQIMEISQNKPLKQLAENLAPEVFGNEIVKKAICLQLVKGVSKERSDGSYSREDIHLLLSGDPGIAKSTILKAVTKRSPKSRMVVGTKTSKVGLGAMAVKDELLNVWSLQCGTLVLTSGSVLCLDEMDKMYKENLSELLEPMSSGTITINKAGISATLPARTSILASANPIEGSFDLQQSLPRQIDLPSPILNRFDLIFVLLDKQNKDFDLESIKHVFGSHTKKRAPTIDINLFKKYIFYCRKLKPKLKPELKEPLTKFYVDLRQKTSKGVDRGIPINLRNMEGIIRLSEAHAKLRLSEYVEEEDLEIAKKIFLYCLNQLATDYETGTIDMSKITEKIPTSKRGKLEKFRDLLQDLSQNNNNLFSYSDILEASAFLDLKNWELNDFLSQLKKGGQIYEPKSGQYSIMK